MFLTRKSKLNDINMLSIERTLLEAGCEAGSVRTPSTFGLDIAVKNDPQAP
jgi:hypothetical protein